MELWPALWPWKVGKIKNPGNIMYPYFNLTSYPWKILIIRSNSTFLSFQYGRHSNHVGCRTSPVFDRLLPRDSSCTHSCTNYQNPKNVGKRWLMPTRVRRGAGIRMARRLPFFPLSGQLPSHLAEMMKYSLINHRTLILVSGQRCWGVRKSIKCIFNVAHSHKRLLLLSLLGLANFHLRLLFLPISGRKESIHKSRFNVLNMPNDCTNRC
jgi:hypothetical protein